MPGKQAVPQVSQGKVLGLYILAGLEKETKPEVALYKQAALGLGLNKRAMPQVELEKKSTEQVGSDASGCTV